MNNDEQTQKHINNLESVFAMDEIKNLISKPDSVSSEVAADGKQSILAIWKKRDEDYGAFKAVKSEDGENKYEQIKLSSYINHGSFITFVSPKYKENNALDINTIRNLFIDAIGKVNNIQNNTQTINLTSNDRSCTLTRLDY